MFSERALEYKFVCAQSTSQLAQKVNKELQKGWELQGSPIYAGEELDIFMWKQAMIKIGIINLSEPVILGNPLVD